MIAPPTNGVSIVAITTSRRASVLRRGTVNKGVRPPNAIAIELRRACFQYSTAMVPQQGSNASSYCPLGGGRIGIGRTSGLFGEDRSENDQGACDQQQRNVDRFSAS